VAVLEQHRDQHRSEVAEVPSDEDVHRREDAPGRRRNG
jgi:hypothetical protein